MIKIENLNVVFNKGTPDENHALKNINLEIDKGDFITVIGSNGAGKSTLYNAIAGTLMPESGRIFLDEENREITFEKEYKEVAEKMKMLLNYAEPNPYAYTTQTVY